MRPRCGRGIPAEPQAGGPLPCEVWRCRATLDILVSRVASGPVVLWLRRGPVSWNGHGQRLLRDLANAGRHREPVCAARCGIMGTGVMNVWHRAGSSESPGRQNRHQAIPLVMDAVAFV